MSAKINPKPIICLMLLSLGLIIASSIYSIYIPEAKVIITTNGGHSVSLKGRVPRAFANKKEDYMKMGAFMYMKAWNSGIEESEGNSERNKFNLEIYAKNGFTWPENNNEFDDLKKYFKETESLFEKVKNEARDFGDERKNNP